MLEGGAERFEVLFRILRVLRRIALWGVLALFALILAAFAINAFDERPSPQALALSQPPENRYKPEENIYVALAGFDAPPGQSVVALGLAKIAHYNEHVDSMLQDPLVGLGALTAPDSAGLKFSGEVDFCRPRERCFWESVRANSLKIEQLVAKNRELYDRYLALFGLSGYYETARPSHTAPIYLPSTEVRNLFIANLASRMQTGDNAQAKTALRSLRQDAELWRRVLTGEGTLISKMVAVAYLQIDSLVLSDFIADSRTAIPQDMDEFLPEFELSTWNISNAFAAEFRVHTFLYRQVQALSDGHWQPPDSSRASRVWNRILSPVEGQFFKINATENLNAKAMNDLAGFAALDPSTFSTNQARLRMWEQENADFFSVRTAYNPVGKILVAIAAPAYQNYVLRPYDAAALQRLTRLSYEIRRQQIAPSAVTAFMKLHPEWSTHPADGRSFVWKQTTGEIAILPVAQQPADRRLSVRIWRPAEG
jgi:hypothetical protein